MASVMLDVAKMSTFLCLFEAWVGEYGGPLQFRPGCVPADAVELREQRVDDANGVGGFTAANGCLARGGQALDLMRGWFSKTEHKGATPGTSSMRTQTKAYSLATRSVMCWNIFCTSLPLSENHLEKSEWLLISTSTPCVKLLSGQRLLCLRSQETPK
jgi:hypothetical protein